MSGAQAGNSVDRFQPQNRRRAALSEKGLRFSAHATPARVGDDAGRGHTWTPDWLTSSPGRTQIRSDGSDSLDTRDGRAIEGSLTVP